MVGARQRHAHLGRDAARTARHEYNGVAIELCLAVARVKQARVVGDLAQHRDVAHAIAVARLHLFVRTGHFLHHHRRDLGRLGVPVEIQRPAVYAGPLLGRRLHDARDRTMTRKAVRTLGRVVVDAPQSAHVRGRHGEPAGQVQRSDLQQVEQTLHVPLQPIAPRGQ